MKIAFNFENGTSQVVLTPENARDKTYLSLCVDGKDCIQIKPSNSDALVVEFTEIKVKPSAKATAPFERIDH